MQLDLQGKHVIVTGASGGIGEAIVQSFAAAGCQVTIHYHNNRTRAEQIRRDHAAQNGWIAQADLTSENDVEKLIAAAVGQFGPVHIFVANAGVWPTADQAIDVLPLDRWNQTIAANLTSSFLCMKHFLAQVKKNRLADPAAVMIGSTAGIFGEAGHADYAAAKAAIVGGLLPSLKNEFCRIAKNGRINVVCPGWTMTPMTRKFANDSAAMTKALQTIALRKFGKPEDVAAAVTFLCSPVAGHITGQVISTSGGMEGRLLYDADEISVD
jgi:3-oxoacyl-[acyl-carrier protein] reductase